MWKALPAPVAGKVSDREIAAVHAKCMEMRDFVIGIQQDTSMQLPAPAVSGPPAPAQPTPAQPAPPPVLTAGDAPGRGRGRGGAGGFRPRGLPAASQPLLTWKYTQFNTHHRNFDPAALRLDTDPPQTRRRRSPNLPVSMPARHPYAGPR